MVQWVQYLRAVEMFPGWNFKQISEIVALGMWHAQHNYFLFHREWYVIIAVGSWRKLQKEASSQFKASLTTFEIKDNV